MDNFVASELYCSTVSPMLLSVSSSGILLLFVLRLRYVTLWEVVVAARKVDPVRAEQLFQEQFVPFLTQYSSGFHYCLAYPVYFDGIPIYILMFNPVRVV